MDCVDQHSLESAQRLAPYISLYDTPAFLTSAMASGSSYRDLVFMKGIREYRAVDRDIADRVLHSLKGQTWYLDQPWIGTALVGPNVPVEEKEMVARALATTPRPKEYPPYCVTPYLAKLACHQEDFWPEDGSLPSLSSLVGPRTWQLFDLLHLDSDQVHWLTLPQKVWEEDANYRRFKDFISHLEVVNDSGERGVKLIQVIYGHQTVQTYISRT